MAETAYKRKSIWAHDPSSSNWGSLIVYSAAHHKGAIVIAASLFVFFYPRLLQSTIMAHRSWTWRCHLADRDPAVFVYNFLSAFFFFFFFQINQLGGSSRLILIGKSLKPWLIVFHSICAVMQNHQWHFEEWWWWWYRISQTVFFSVLFFNHSTVLRLKWLIYSSVQLIIHIESSTHLPTWEGGVFSIKSCCQRFLKYVGPVSGEISCCPPVKNHTMGWKRFQTFPSLSLIYNLIHMYAYC